MSINNMKAGYQGKKDSMREFADKLTKNAGHAPDTIYSKSCADKARMRIYKEGGMVDSEEEYERKKLLHSNNHIEKMKKDISKEEERERREEREKMKEKKPTFKADEAYKKGGSVKKCNTYRQKFAEGGIGKYRHDQMTLSGKQKGTKQDPYSNNY